MKKIRPKRYLAAGTLIILIIIGIFFAWRHNAYPKPPAGCPDERVTMTMTCLPPGMCTAPTDGAVPCKSGL